MKHSCRRWISIFMVAILIVTSMSTDLYAATGKAAETIVFTEAEPAVQALPASRIEDLAGQEAVYFGTATADLTEGDAYYSLPVYREGNLDTAASVSLLTLDISALYGADYEISAEEVFVAGTEQTLLEKSGGNNLVISDEEAEENVAAVGNLFRDTEGAEDTESDAAEETEAAAADEAAADAAAGTETEAEGTASEPELGALSTSILGSLTGSTETEITGEQIEEALSSENLDFSAGTVLYFERGETEKIITFHVFEDELEEGQEMFQFVLADAEGTSVKDQYTFAAVINDNEELQDAFVSFSAESYSSEGSEVTVTVERTGSTYSMIDFYLKSARDTAVPGSNYTEFNELVSMQPYQTSAEYTFEVSGQGRMEVVLVPETACTVSGSDTAEVLIDVPETEGASEEEETELLGDNINSFAIELNGEKERYIVKYTGDGSSATKGGIYDKTYQPEPLKVGDYYFATDKQCSYGHYDGDSGHRESNYVSAQLAQDCCGHLYWYSGWCWRTGSSYFKTTCEIPSTYYRYVLPDWQGLHWACFYQTHEFLVKSALGTLQKDIKIRGAGSRDGEFSRRLDSRVRIDLPYSWQNTLLTLEPHTADRLGGATPKNGLNVYGFACLYKAYDIRVSGYSALEYRTAGGSTLSSIPFRVHLQAGAQSEYSADKYHRVYTDSEEKQSQIVFSPAAVYLNGHSGIFGQITGYNITYNCESAQEKQKVLKYPEDFFSYMDSQIGKDHTGHDHISWTTETVAARKKKAQDSILTVSFDKYLIDWLMSVGISVEGEKATFDDAVKLSFQPILTYTDVNVTVLEPTYGSGEFKDGNLTVTKTGEKPHVYHAGDTLDLTAQATAAKMIAVGYQISTDNGLSFDDIYSTTQLFLDRDHPNVMIRPIITSNQNRIEIQFEGDAEKHLSVANLIDPDELEGTVYEGKNLYDVNPQKSNVIERARPTVGQVYQIQITVKDKPSEAGYVYRPVVYDPISQRTNTQMYPLAAKADPTDNVIKIGLEKVKEDSLMDVTVTGAVNMVPLRYLRDSAEARDGVPVTGYSVIAFASQIKDKSGNDIISLQQAVTDNKGTYKLTGLKARAGDVIPVLVTGGFGAGQMGRIVVGTSGQVSASTIKITYPYDAPQVTSVMYSYGNDQHNIERDLNENTINIYDDSLEFQITVDEKGRTAGRVIVTIVPYDENQSLEGESYDIEAKRKTAAELGAENGTSDVWVARIEKMTKKLNPGDRVYVHVVDAEKMKVLVNGQERETEIAYPVMDTGLKFYTEFVPKVPQWFDASLDKGDAPINIPIMGAGNQLPGATSGLISWDQTRWPDGNGYTMTINLGVGIDDISALVKMGRYKTFEYNHKTALKNKKAAELEALQHLQNTEHQREILESEIHNLNEQLQLNREARKAAGAEMSDPKGKATETHWSADATTLIALYFVKAGNDYVYAVGNVVFGFTGTIDYTKFVMFSFVPGYLNVGGVLQLGYSGQWSQPAGVQGLSSGVFQNKKGNLKEVIGTKSGLTSGEFTFGITGYGGVGVGAKDCLGAKGSLSITFQCGVPTPNPDNQQNGYMVDFFGGFKIDLVLTSISIDVMRIRQGWGAWKDRSQISWFGHVDKYSPTSLGDAMLASMELREEELLSVDGNEVTSLVEKLPGTSDMSSFGAAAADGALLGAGNEEELYASPVELLGNAADDPRIQTVATDEKGSLFMIFIGNRGDKDGGTTENGNAEAVYYTLYSASAGSWTEPKLLDPDGTYDTTPSLTLEDGIITATWSSAEEAFDGESSLAEKLSGLRIKAVRFRVLEDGSAEQQGEVIWLSGNMASPSVAKKKTAELTGSAEEETETAAEAAETTAETTAEADLLSSEAEAGAAGEETGTEEEPETGELLSGFTDLSTYADINGKSWTKNGRIYSLFTRYDLSGIKGIEEILDYSKVKPAVYLAEYDVGSGVLLTLRNLSLTSGNSLLMTSEAELVTVNGYGEGTEKCADKSFLVISYTRDTDGDTSTEEDNDLMCCLVETHREGCETFVYPAMEISYENGVSCFNAKIYDTEEYDENGELISEEESEEDSISDGSLFGAQIVETAGSYYLTYVKDGYLFEVVDIGEYIETMFTFDVLAELYRARAKASGGGLLASGSGKMLSGTENGDAWYELDYESLVNAWNIAGSWTENIDDSASMIKYYGYPGTEENEGEGTLRLSYENSALEDIATGELNTMETCLSGSTDEKTGINAYQVVSDGDDLYILYTDYPADRVQPNKELFCVKLNFYNEYRDTEDTESEIYFSEPVQLTNAGKVISNFRASMSDGVITVVSDTYGQSFPEEGGIVFTENSIVETKYRPKPILQIMDSLTASEFAFSNEENGANYIRVSYAVTNAGLEPQKGYRTWVEKDGVKIFEADQLEEASVASAVDEDGNEILPANVTQNDVRLLCSGDTDSYSFHYPVAGSGENDRLKLVVADASGTILDTAELTISREQSMDISYAEAVRTQEGYEAVITVKNTGNVSTEASTVKLNLLGDNFTAVKTYGSVEVPALRAGESREIRLSFAPLYTDFTENGTLNLEAALPEKDGSGYPIYYVAGSPDMVVIENGQETVMLSTGQSRKLTVTAEPLSEDTGAVMYSVDDPTVVSIAQDGTIQGLKAGTAEVTAYLTHWGLSDTVKVIVSTKPVEDDDNTESASSLPSYVEVDGSWKQDAGGSWTFTTRAGVKAISRWMAIARSTFGGGNGFEWFRFDKDGNMVTGWFKDSDDRMYYLQMISDGNKGRMLTGWQKIDGKWYYFSTVSNGYKGELLKNTTTPDGYKVGADGAWTEN